MSKKIEIRSNDLYETVSYCGNGGDGDGCNWSDASKSIVGGASGGALAGAAMGLPEGPAAALSGAAIGGLGGAIAGAGSYGSTCWWDD